MESTKKFRLTEEVKIYNGVELHRIEALKDFGGVKRGDKGGWVRHESNLSQQGGCWIFDDAIVTDNARVFDNAVISGNAIVCDDAIVRDYAIVSGNAYVQNEANVLGFTHVYYNAVVRGKAVIYSSTIEGNAVIESDAHIKYKTVHGTIAPYYSANN